MQTVRVKTIFDHIFVGQYFHLKKILSGTKEFVKCVEADNGGVSWKKM